MLTINDASMKSLLKFCLQAWSRNLAKSKPVCKDEILNTPIFGNINIATKNKQSILFTHWCASANTKVNDLWGDKGQFKSGTEIVNKLNWIVEYEIIKHAIPKNGRAY